MPESYRSSGTTSQGFEEAKSVKNYTMVPAPVVKDSICGGDLKRTDLQLRIPSDEAEAYGFSNNATLVFNVSLNTLGSMGTFINFNFFKSKSRDRIGWLVACIGGFDQPPVAQSLWDNQNLTATSANAGLALSNWVRDHTNATHAGASQEYIIYIHVRWEYLTLPLLVVTVGCLIILMSVWEIRRLRLPDCRSNVISTLTHSLDAEARAYHGLGLKAHMD